MFHIHKWSKWVYYEKEVKRKVLFNDSILMYNEGRQKRWCLKCGYNEDYLVNVNRPKTNC